VEVIKSKDLKQAFYAIDDKLNNVEVKGESVRFLFEARNIIKKLYDSIAIEEVEEDGKKEK
jgi:hypothetical protein